MKGRKASVNQVKQQGHVRGVTDRTARWRQGQRAENARFELLREIRRRLDDGESREQIVAALGCELADVAHVCLRRQTWAAPGSSGYDPRINFGGQAAQPIFRIEDVPDLPPTPAVAVADEAALHAAAESRRAREDAERAPMEAYLERARSTMTLAQLVALKRRIGLARLIFPGVAKSLA